MHLSPCRGCLKSKKNKISRGVPQSFTPSLAKLKHMFSTFCETQRFICEPLRERKNYLLDSPTGVEVISLKTAKSLYYSMIILSLCVIHPLMPFKPVVAGWGQRLVRKGSFISQGVYRIEAGRFPGRVPSEKDPDSGRKYE